MFNQYTKNNNFNHYSDVDTSKNGIRGKAENIKEYTGYSRDQKDLIINNSLTLHYSYDTVVAFETPGRLVISENEWSRTTVKHLNHIDRDKDKRISEKEFEDQLIEVLQEYNLV